MQINEGDISAVNEVLAGDKSAFSALVDRYGDMVYSLVKRIVGNSEDARDITQDIFVKVYSSLNKYNGTSAFSTWLYRVAYNAAISHIRKRRHHHSSVDDERSQPVADDDMEAAFRRAASEKRYADLESALSRLAPEERAMITLFYMEEHSVSDISDITGISLANVKVKLHRIRKKIFILMEEQHGK